MLKRAVLKKILSIILAILFILPLNNIFAYSEKDNNLTLNSEKYVQTKNKEDNNQKDTKGKKTKRFIIKYKDQSKVSNFDELSSINTEKESKSLTKSDKTNKKINKKSKIKSRKSIKNKKNKRYDFITTESETDTAELLSGIDKSVIDENIEYIQPDSEILLNSINEESPIVNNDETLSSDPYFANQWSIYSSQLDIKYEQSIQEMNSESIIPTFDSTDFNLSFQKVDNTTITYNENKIYFGFPRETDMLSESGISITSDPAITPQNERITLLPSDSASFEPLSGKEIYTSSEAGICINLILSQPSELTLEKDEVQDIATMPAFDLLLFAQNFEQTTTNTSLNIVIPDHMSEVIRSGISIGHKLSIQLNVEKNNIQPNNMETGKINNQVSYPTVNNGIISAWNQSQGDGVLVAVIDSGIDITHEDLSGNIFTNPREIPNNGVDDDLNGCVDDVNGWNFTDKTNEVHNTNNIADEGHGTHIAGIIAAMRNNGKGIAGVAPNAKILPIKVFKNGVAYTSDIIDAITYAEKMGVKIINCSWGTYENNPALKEAIENSSMLFVCAAGNNGTNNDISPCYPASFECPNIVSVAATDKNDSLCAFSNYGQMSVDISAPGEDIISTLPADSYGNMSGTSMATGFVSGEGALLYAKYSSQNSIEIKDIILHYSDKLGALQGKINNSSKLNYINALNMANSRDLVSETNVTKEASETRTVQGTPGYNLYATESLAAKLSMPTSRSALGVVALDGKIYAIGGYNGSTYFGTVEVYDPVSNSWSTKTSMPTARSNFGAAVANGKIYTIGGQNSSGLLRTVEEYNPVTDTWVTKTSMPTARTVSAAELGGQIYAIGGYGYYTYYNGSSYLDYTGTVEAYNPLADTWATKASMRCGRTNLSTITINGKIYAIGGYTGYSNYNDGFPTSYRGTNCVEEYNPETDSWTYKANMPPSFLCQGVSKINGKIYLEGGFDYKYYYYKSSYNGSYTPTNYRKESSTSIYEYDPVLDSWTSKISLPQRVGDAGTATVNGKVYLLGGENCYSTPITSSYITGYSTRSYWCSSCKTNHYSSYPNYSYYTSGYSYTSNILNTNYEYTSSVDPNIPSSLATKSTGYKITLNWNELDNARWYEVEADNSKISSTSGISMIFTGLTPSISHTYRVRAITATGANEWSLPITASAQNDDYGDEISTAASALLNTEKQGSINYVGDIDYFSYTPSRTAYYHIESTGSSDTYGYLYDNNGSLINSNDNIGNGNNNFKFVQLLNANQPYYIRINHSNTDGTGLYGLKISDDDYSNSTVAAAAVSVGYTKGYINYSGDEDYFAFTPITSGNYDFGTNSTIDTYGYLYSSSGTQLTYNDDHVVNGSVTRDFYFSYYLTANQTYYIKIRHYNNVTTGNYAFYINPKIAPTISVNITNAAWRNTDIAVEPTFTAYGGASISTKQYAWSTSTSAAITYTSYSSGNITQSQSGIWYLHTKTTDNFGNSSYTWFGPYKIDKTIPDITASAIIATESGINCFALQPIVTDAISGLSNVSYAWNNSTQTPTTWNNYTGAILPQKSIGNWYLFVKAKDNTQNEAIKCFGPYNTLIMPQKFRRIPFSNDVVLTWEGVNGADSYDVSIDGVIVANTSNTFYKQMGIQSSESHKYKVRARAGNFEGEWSEEITQSTPDTNVAICMAEISNNKIFNIAINSSNIQQFGQKTFTVKYNSNELDVIDLCALTPELELAPADIPDKNLVISNVIPGEITFYIENPEILEDYNETLNIIQFKSKVNGETAIYVQFN